MKTSKTQKIAAVGMLLLLNQWALADASFEETTQITGGTLVDTLKQVSFIGKSIKEMLAPTNTITMVHGNQKATITKESTEIVDLDKGAMIHIDNEKKTYTVTTFAQMRAAFTKMSGQMQQMQAQQQQQMKDAQAKMKAQQAQDPAMANLKMTFDVKVNNTGVTKMVNGLMAQEQIVTMTMKFTLPPDAAGTPPPAPAPGTPDMTSMAYTVTTDAWIAPDPPVVKEIQDFDMRMGQKMMEGVDMSAMMAQMKAGRDASSAAMSQMFAGQPGAADAMAEMGKEMAKIKGTRVLEVTSMGGTGTGPATQTAAAPAPAKPAPTGGSVAGDIATDTATQTASQETSKLGTFGSALGNSTLSAFRKKKAATPPPAAAPAAPAAGTATGTQTTSAVLMSTTTQKTNFSQETVPVSAFQIPAGYKLVPSPMEQMSK